MSTHNIVFIVQHTCFQEFHPLRQSGCPRANLEPRGDKSLAEGTNRPGQARSQRPWFPWAFPNRTPTGGRASLTRQVTTTWPEGRRWAPNTQSLEAERGDSREGLPGDIQRLFKAGDSKTQLNCFHSLYCSPATAVCDRRWSKDVILENSNSIMPCVLENEASCHRIKNMPRTLFTGKEKTLLSWIWNTAMWTHEAFHLSKDLPLNIYH